MKSVNLRWLHVLQIILLIGSFGLVAWSTHQVRAASIDVSGLGAADAKIYDQTGQDVTQQPELDRYTSYRVDYQWTIPNNVPIQAGDTATFTLPATVIPGSNLTFDLLNQEKQSVVIIS